MSTSPTANVSTPRQVPIRTALRCLRVIPTNSRSRLQAELSGQSVKLLQRFGVSAELGLGPRERFQGIVLPVKHGIGSDQLEPTGKIVALLRQPIVKPLYHGLDYGLAVNGG